MRLPESGREGPPPEWPLSRPKVAETKLWAELWSCPQAVAWERMGSATVRTVARYARLVLAAEKPGAVASLQNETRQFEDRLGLTPMAMLRLQWEIAADEVSEARQERQTSATPSKQRRLAAVDPDAVVGE